MEHAWSPAPARVNRKGGADLEPATAGRGAMVCFLWRPARLLGFPLAGLATLLIGLDPGAADASGDPRGGVSVAQVRRTPAVKKGRAVNCSLLANDGYLFHRNGGPVTTILSREGRSPRMTFRICRISSRRGAIATARRPGYLATST